MKRSMLLIFLVGLTWCQVHSQDKESTDSIVGTDTDWIQLLEEVTENCENEEQSEKWLEQLAELAENPIDLNSATKETLETIPFLNQNQLEELSYYLYRYGPMQSLSELLLIEGMDEQTMRWMKPFIYLDKPGDFPVEMPPLKKALKFGKQELRLRFGRSLQTKKGYEQKNDGSGANYQGDPWHVYGRYAFNYKGKLQWGFVMEKDAGEKWWNKQKSTVDYSSFHLLLKDQKRFKTLVLGDYKLKFGQGLVCASTFSMGKSVSSTNLEQTGSEINRHFSSSESGFLRGLAATFVLKPYEWKQTNNVWNFGLEASVFASARKLDANVVHDSFPTISSVELHRTEAESNIKNQLGLYTIGTHLLLRTEKGQFGFTALAYQFSATWNPENKPYHLFSFRGSKAGNASMDYRLRWNGLLFFGEMAIDEQKNYAGIAGLTLKPYQQLDLSLLGRNYAAQYHAFYSGAFSEGSSTSNEKGFFATCEWRFIRNVRLNAYCDVFTFPWLKFGVNAPSEGSDYALQATWLPSSRSQISLRFKSSEKWKNASLEYKGLSGPERQLKHQARLQITSTHHVWSLKSVLEGNQLALTSQGKRTVGFAASQELSFRPTSKILDFSIRYVLFDTDHFDNRIYSYEKDLPGSYSMIPFYGKGSRFSLLIKTQIHKNMYLQVKLGQTSYRDREEVGTALEEVKGHHLTDIRSLFTWKF